MSEQKLYHLWFSGKQARVGNPGYTYYSLVETAAATKRHHDAICSGSNPEVAVTEASESGQPSGEWDDYTYLGRGFWSRDARGTI